VFPQNGHGFNFTAHPPALACIFMYLTKNHNHTWERSGVLAVPELQPAADEANFHVWFLVDIVMEEPRVRAGRYQHDHGGIRLFRLLRTLLNPVFDRPTIGWIAVDRLTLPWLFQAVFRNGEISVAFVVFVVGAWVKCEMEFGIQLVEECLWSFPVHFVG